MNLFKRTDVLDQGWIELVDMLPHPQTGVSGDLAIVNAARTSFLGESKGEVADKKLLFYLLRNHHTSPFEMVEFKFRIHAPLLTWWQLVRYRTANLNMQSGRYTPFEDDCFYVPDTWRAQSSSNKQSSDGEVDRLYAIFLTADLQDHYERSFMLYQKALEYGVAKEQARLFLPGFAVYYTGVWKIDAHNLMHVIEQRTAPEAQHEIRVYAQAMYEDFFKPALPWTAEAFETYRLNKDG